MKTFPTLTSYKKGSFSSSQLVFGEENLLHTKPDDEFLVLDVPRPCRGISQHTQKHCHWKQTAQTPELFFQAITGWRPQQGLTTACYWNKKLLPYAWWLKTPRDYFPSSAADRGVLLLLKSWRDTVATHILWLKFNCKYKILTFRVLSSFSIIIKTNIKDKGTSVLPQVLLILSLTV